MNKVQASETNWVEVYRAALLETDQTKLRDRIVAAQKALRERVIELKEDGEGSAQEIRALEDALRALRSLLELYIDP
jgi:hypothetical protein